MEVECRINNEIFNVLRIGLLVGIILFSGLAVAKEIQGTLTEDELREVIVSRTDENGILQLFRMKEDGSDSLQFTHSKEAPKTLFAQNMKKVLLTLLLPLAVWAEPSKPNHLDITLATLFLQL